MALAAKHPTFHERCEAGLRSIEWNASTIRDWTDGQARVIAHESSYPRVSGVQDMHDRSVAIRSRLANASGVQ